MSVKVTYEYQCPECGYIEKSTQEFVDNIDDTYYNRIMECERCGDLSLRSFELVATKID